MTSLDIKEGVQLTLTVAHQLKDELGRIPHACEIRWRVATVFQARWTSMDRRSAVDYASRLMEVVATATDDHTT